MNRSIKKILIMKLLKNLTMVALSAMPVWAQPNMTTVQIPGHSVHTIYFSKTAIDEMTAGKEDNGLYSAECNYSIKKGELVYIKTDAVNIGTVIDTVLSSDSQEPPLSESWQWSLVPSPETSTVMCFLGTEYRSKLEDGSLVVTKLNHQNVFTGSYLLPNAPDGNSNRSFVLGALANGYGIFDLYWTKGDNESSFKNGKLTIKFDVDASGEGEELGAKQTQNPDGKIYEEK